MSAIDAFREEDFADQPTTAKRVELVLAGTKDPETNPDQPIKLRVILGPIRSEFENFPGQPSAYYVRTEGETHSFQISSGSFEDMVQDLLGSKALDFIPRASKKPEDLKKAAEDLKTKLEDPAIQRRIKALYAERNALREELKGR